MDGIDGRGGVEGTEDEVASFRGAEGGSYCIPMVRDAIIDGDLEKIHGIIENGGGNPKLLLARQCS